MAAEGLSDRSDEADFAGRAVGKTELARGLAALVGDLLERPAGVDALVDLGGRNNEAASPMAVGVERHEFDKAHDDAGLAGVGSESFDFVVVDTAEKDLVLVMRSNFSGSSESRLILMRRRPAAMSRSHRSASRWPLVVMERSSTPRAWRRAIKSSTPSRTSGSPPVMRILRMPRLRKIVASRSSSGQERISS